MVRIFSDTFWGPRAENFRDLFQLRRSFQSLITKLTVCVFVRVWVCLWFRSWRDLFPQKKPNARVGVTQTHTHTRKNTRRVALVVSDKQTLWRLAAWKSKEPASSVAVSYNWKYYLYFVKSTYPFHIIYCLLYIFFWYGNLMNYFSFCEIKFSKSRNNSAKYNLMIGKKVKLYFLCSSFDCHIFYSTAFTLLPC